MEEKKKEEMESRGGKGSGEEFNEKRKEKLPSIYIYIPINNRWRKTGLYKWKR